MSGQLAAILIVTSWLVGLYFGAGWEMQRDDTHT